MCIRDRKYPDLCLLPSAQTRDKDAVTPEQMVELINELREEFDYILPVSYTHLDWEWHDGKMKTRLEYRLLKNEWQGQQLNKNSSLSNT